MGREGGDCHAVPRHATPCHTTPCHTTLAASPGLETQIWLSVARSFFHAFHVLLTPLEGTPGGLISFLAL